MRISPTPPNIDRFHRNAPLNHRPPLPSSIWADLRTQSHLGHRQSGNGYNAIPTHKTRLVLRCRLLLRTRGTCDRIDMLHHIIPPSPNKNVLSNLIGRVPHVSLVTVTERKVESLASFMSVNAFQCMCV